MFTVPGSTVIHVTDELGAHVSSAGGVEHAPARAAEIDAAVLQLFTKQPNRWAERDVDADKAEAFQAARAEHGIRIAAAHDSYLINLATPDKALFDRSCHSFRMELARCAALRLDYLVTHPGNATDGDADRGLAQNAEAIERALEEVNGNTTVLLETTAGSGRALGASFEELAALVQRVRSPIRHRVGICLDTCHVWAAGYDLRGDYDGVLDRFDDVLGLERLKLFHFNDSKMPFGSRCDRHAHIGRGTIGDEPFVRLMNDARLGTIPKILETPKEDDTTTSDRQIGRAHV